MIFIVSVEVMQVSIEVTLAENQQHVNKSLHRIKIPSRGGPGGLPAKWFK